MRRRLVCVTGATDGIGMQTVMDLGRVGADVIVHGRSAEKVAAVIASATKACPGVEFHPAVCDLSRLSDVRALGNDLVRRFPRLDVLINNAGVFAKSREMTADGLELTFAVNHLAPFLLTHLLLPSLLAANHPPGRIINVSSMAHRRARLPTVASEYLPHAEIVSPYDGLMAYSVSKAANIAFTRELARRVADAGVPLATFSLHPGVVSTKLLAAGFGGMSGPDSLAAGASTSVRLATAALPADGGAYFESGVVRAPAAAAQDPAAAAALWRASNSLTGVSPCAVAPWWA